MPEIRHQQSGGSPELESAEIHIPDDHDLGTGSFTTVLRPRALTSESAIMSILVNRPSFQVSVTINPNGEIPILLGKADGSEPLSRKVFLLPRGIERNTRHRIRAEFANWEILSAIWDDGIALNERL